MGKILLSIISLIIGYLIAVLIIRPSETIEYKSGPIVKDTVSITKEVYKVDTITKIKLVEKVKILKLTKPQVVKNDTVYVIDSAKVLEDWKSIRGYKTIVFNNDTLGKLVLDQEVQFNRLKSSSYTYKPITKIINSGSDFHLIIGSGLTTDRSYLIQGSIIYGHIGIGYQYRNQFNTSESSHGIIISYKF